MRNFFIGSLFVSLVAFIYSCNSYDVQGQPEVSSDPEKWVVDYALKEDSKSQEFRISNKGFTGALEVYAINLLDVEGKILKNDDIFKFKLSKTAKGIAVYNKNDEPEYGKDSVNSYPENKIINPLCPVKEENGKMVCKSGFDPAKYNSKFSIEVTYTPSEGKKSGAYYLELCTNDPGKSSSATCGKGTSHKIQIIRLAEPPAKPRAILNCRKGGIGAEAFEAIYDDVTLDASVSGLYDEAGNKLDDSKYKYEYKWEMVQTPTPTLNETKLNVTPNAWLSEPLVTFKGLVTTPNNIGDKKTIDEAKCKEAEDAYNKALSECASITDSNKKQICEDEALHNNIYNMDLYCDEYKDNHYLIKMSVRALDTETGLYSSEVTTYCRPEIIPPSRFQVQLQMKGIEENPDDAKIDLDLHVIRKGTSTSDCVPKYTSGYMCTKAKYVDGVAGTATHDDVYFGDPGNVEDTPRSWNNGTLEETGDWNATLDLDNTEGDGGKPETVNVGPYRKNLPVLDGEYLIVVNYFDCNDYGKGICDKPVEPTITITIDGKEAPRKAGADPNHPDSDKIIRKFKIKKGEYAVIAKVVWDKTWVNNDPTKQGNGQVLSADDYPWCTAEFCKNAPVWDIDEYKKWVEKSNDTSVYPHDDGSPTACDNEGYYYETSSSGPRGACRDFDAADVTLWSEKK